MPVLAWYPCLCVDDVERSVDFYTALLGLEVTACVGWYVEVGRSPADVVVAVVERGHSSVPAGFDTLRGGMLVSVLVDDAPALAAAAIERGTTIVQSLRDEPFGQRHFMAVDPDGFLVDVIQRIRPSGAFLRDLALGRRRRR
jgi:catechol 2,3-dioxygenase-like lactoylglutathione lyase family enzyme